MIVEQPDAFKSWLTAVLKPMCEADPAALAKYVIALIKKDKADDELRKTMVGQLEVFLQEETEPFVNLMFQTLQSQEYLRTPLIPNANPPNPNIVKKDKESVKEKVIVQPSELPNLTEQINGSAGVKKDLEVPKKEREIKEKPKEELKEEKRPTRSRRDRSLSRDRLRSRSRSWDRAKRSRSRDNKSSPTHRTGGASSAGEKRERSTRVWRNYSPPSRSSRYDRRRSPISPSGRRSRSPRYHRSGRYRNRSLDRSRSRSRSIEKPRRNDSGKEGPVTPSQDANHSSDTDLRLNNPPTGRVIAPSSKRRCRDFDEKGYCMRGEMCLFDHGVDPVVLEDAALSRVLNYNPNGTAGDVPANLAPPIIGAPGHPMMGPRGIIPSEYNPQAPFLRGFRGPRPLGPNRLPGMGMFPPPQANMNRELIPVPVMDNKQNPYSSGYPPHSNFIPLDNHDQSSFYHQRKNKFDFNRLGPRSAGKNPSNCSLELKKIPIGLNSITHLNNHFAKFGKIINIQVNYEGDSEAALVTFSSHAEASAAYRSTEAVLNNRFIKVFWHNTSNNDGKQENVPPRPVKERLGINQIVPPNTNKVFNLVQPKADEPGSETTNMKPEDPLKLAQNKEEAKAQATAAIKKNQELLAAKEKLKKNQDEQLKEVLKIKQDLQKRKQELLEKQLSQQKILLEKMEKLPAGPQRDLIKDTIKKTQESIEEIRKDIAHSTLVLKPSGGVVVPPKKTKEDAQKEMLDIELDLITKQQEGADVTEIQKKYFELKAKTSMLRGRGRGRRYNPIQRHLLSKNNLVDNSGVIKSVTKIDRTNNFQKSNSMHSVDHRPTRILVSGYEIEEQESVIAHFQQFGEVVDYVTDSALPSVTFNFKARKDAENALLKGKNFQDRTLSITWCTNVQLNNQINNSRTTRKLLVSESEEEQLIDHNLIDAEEDPNVPNQDIPEEVLLQDDEEDDDEDRSWRR